MLASLLKARGYDLRFNMLDIGALPIDGQTEPFHKLLETYPSSRLSGLEIDPRLCDELNRKAPATIRYYPCALGRTEEKRRLYDTVHPMCASLYAPDERYADLFDDLEVMRLKGTSEISTVSLDRFVNDHGLGAIDFVKIDIQGAELDVFQGGISTLRNLLFVVCEVEFVPLYHGQPLFGDVDAWLRRHGMMFHKFPGIAWRMMKPFGMHRSADRPVQFLWGDAVFVRDLFGLDALSGEQMLKLAVLLDLYDSNDVALHLLRRYDAGHGTGLGDIYLHDLTVSGPWQSRPSEQRKQS